MADLPTFGDFLAAVPQAGMSGMREGVDAVVC